MGMARKAGAGGGNWLNRWRQRVYPQEKGIPVPGTGVSHYHKQGTGSNKAGLLTGQVPWESHKGAKRHDGQRNVNNTARDQAVAEQLADHLDAEFDPDYEGAPFYGEYPSRHTAEYAGLDSLADLPPGVTFNGQSAEHYAYDDDPGYRWADDTTTYDWPSDSSYAMHEDFTSRLAIEMAENARLRAEVSRLQGELQEAQLAAISEAISTHLQETRLEHHTERMSEAFHAGWAASTDTGEYLLHSPERAFHRWMSE